MKAAIVTGPNQIPVYGDFKEPVARTGQELITVIASALSPAAKALAAGSHYSSSGMFPMVVGIDGVGYTQSGQRVHFGMPQAPFGGMAEKVLVLAENCVPLPDEVEDVIAAAIATGRDSAALQQVKNLGADITINLLLEQKDLEGALGEQFSGDGVDVVLDYLFGKRAETLLTTIARTSKGSRPIRYVAIGGVTGQEITLSSSVLRAVPIAIMGSGIGSVPWKSLMEAASDVMQAVVPGKLQIETTVYLDDHVEAL